MLKRRRTVSRNREGSYAMIRNRGLAQIGLKLELEKVVSLDFDKGSNDKYDHSYSLPVLSGPHQNRPWVKSLKRLVSIN